MALLVAAAKATRGKALDYQLKTTWPSHAEGELYLNNIHLLENPWSRGNLDISVGGDRTRKLKCPYPGCKAKANVKFLSGDITPVASCVLRWRPRPVGHGWSTKRGGSVPKNTREGGHGT